MLCFESLMKDKHLIFALALSGHLLQPFILFDIFPSQSSLHAISFLRELKETTFISFRLNVEPNKRTKLSHIQAMLHECWLLSVPMKNNTQQAKPTTDSGC